MKVIGLTGGIGSGKSTVTDYLQKKGYLVIDADAIARMITKKGTETLTAIVNCFGRDILLPDGNLNRKMVAKIIFNDEDKKQQYERMTTLVVVDLIKKEVTSLRREKKYDIIFIDAPLLFEVGLDQITDLVWTITAKEDIRIARVTARDNVSDVEIKDRIKHQMPPEKQAELSQEVIDNSKGKEDLYTILDGLLDKYAK